MFDRRPPVAMVRRAQGLRPSDEREERCHVGRPSRESSTRKTACRLEDGYNNAEQTVWLEALPSPLSPPHKVKIVAIADANRCLRSSPPPYEFRHVDFIVEGSVKSSNCRWMSHPLLSRTCSALECQSPPAALERRLNELEWEWQSLARSGSPP